MQEYWVNVYEYFGKRWLGDCQEIKPKVKVGFTKPIYCLHIKIGAKSSRIFYPYVWKDGKAVEHPKIRVYDASIDRNKFI